MHPRVSRDDTELLNQDLSGGEKLRVRIRGEGARLNINALLEGQDRAVLLNLFTLWGLSSDDADMLIDRLTDWIDDDIGRQMNGAEQSEYEAAGIIGSPANRPFRSVDEMGQVLGMEVLIRVNPDWREAFTIFGDGKVDVNEASSDILQAAAGLTPEMTEDILRMRRGDDEIEPSEDDYRFESLAELSGWLQASTQSAAEAVARLTTESTVKRIDSRGMVDDCERQISVVTATGSGGPSGKYLLWEER